MLREKALDRIAIGGSKKILFSPWPEVERNLGLSFKHTQHEIVFGEVPPGGGDFDLVVPCLLPALQAAGKDEVLKQRNPLPIPSAEAIDLCDDKAALNAFLETRGFGRHLPRKAPVGHYPYILKLRRDSCARNAHRIAGLIEEQAHAAIIDSHDYLRQEWIGGSTEYTAHLLHYGGRVHRALSISFLMQDGCAVRGRDPVVLHRRCPVRHVPLFESMLNVVGFEGLCCVNYKERDRVPILFEINPRFGFSLAPYFSAFVRSLEWGRAGLRA